MEKRKPTYDLDSFKAALSAPEKLCATGTAIRDARSLGFSSADMVEAIQEMERHHFYKSMTSYADRTAWQDVYHAPFRDLVLYIKFTADRVAEFRLLSFKEK
jgi:motility quorum-sensing regulator/GCU-specific mRNA interferase toxin